MPQNSVSTRQKKKELFPTFPRTGNAVDLDKLVFQWTPIDPRRSRQPVIYRLLVFLYKPNRSVSKIIKERPVYIKEKLKKPYHKYSKRSGILKKNKAYLWIVEARDKKDHIVLTSRVEGFRHAPASSFYLDSDGRRVRQPSRIGGLSVTSEVVGEIAGTLPDFIPHAPHVWGCPVKLRLLGSLEEIDTSITPPDSIEEPYETVPLALVWASEAARVYLIPSFRRHLRLRWDYRHISGCEQVLLQIAGEGGFRMPNAEDAHADPGTRVWYTGPSFIDHQECGEFIPRLGLRGRSPSYYADDLNIGYTDNLSLLLLNPDMYYLRLAPLDADGNQIGPASDPVTVVCVDYPGIELAQHNIEWEWGESPLRRIYFSIRLIGDFPSLFPIGWDEFTPTTLIIRSRTGRYGGWYEAVGIEDISLIRSNGVPVTLNGTWYGNDAYFWQLDSWERDAWHSFYYEQTCSNLADFTDFNFAIDCIPGIAPDWIICKGSLLDDQIPPIGSTEPCEIPNLFITIDELSVGLGPIYNLFTSRLTGRRVSDRDGVQDVQIRFTFSIDGNVNLPTGAEFRMFILLSSQSYRYAITMEETIDGTLREFDFRWFGFSCEIRNMEDRMDCGSGSYGTPIYSGPLVLDPPRLEMRFDGLEYYLEQA
jgi:hypothetical protein